MKNKIFNTGSVWVIVNLMILHFPMLFSVMLFESFQGFIDAVNGIEKGVKVALLFIGSMYQFFLLYLCSKY